MGNPGVHSGDIMTGPFDLAVLAVLAVLATHGRGGQGRLLHGSIARCVLLRVGV